jgi:hypothetical protein
VSKIKVIRKIREILSQIYSFGKYNPPYLSAIDIRINNNKNVKNFIRFSCFFKRLRLMGVEVVKVGKVQDIPHNSKDLNYY